MNDGSDKNIVTILLLSFNFFNIYSSAKQEIYLTTFVNEIKEIFKRKKKDRKKIQ